MSLLCNWNGRIVNEEEVCISPNNRAFRYGDGCFETMKVVAGRILLYQFHWERLYSSLHTLQFTIPSTFNADFLHDQVKELVSINGHTQLGRARLVLYRGDGGLYDLDNEAFHFIIQSWPAKSDANLFNDTGLRLGVFTEAKIAADLYSSLKSNNYLRQAMAAKFVHDNHFDDCILTNSFGSIVDTTIANVFIVINGVIKTPALTEGPVAGVMRRFLLHNLEKESIVCKETEISMQELYDASEVFVTNAMIGIRWVQSIGDKEYTRAVSRNLYNRYLVPLFFQSTF